MSERRLALRYLPHLREFPTLSGVRCRNGALRCVYLPRLRQSPSLWLTECAGALYTRVHVDRRSRGGEEKGGKYACESGWGLTCYCQIQYIISQDYYKHELGHLQPLIVLYNIVITTKTSKAIISLRLLAKVTFF